MIHFFIHSSSCPLKFAIFLYRSSIIIMKWPLLKCTKWYNETKNSDPITWICWAVSRPPRLFKKLMWKSTCVLFRQVTEGTRILIRGNGGFKVSIIIFHVADILFVNRAVAMIPRPHRIPPWYQWSHECGANLLIPVSPHLDLRYIHSICEKQRRQTKRNHVPTYALNPPRILIVWATRLA